MNFWFAAPVARDDLQGTGMSIHGRYASWRATHATYPRGAPILGSQNSRSPDLPVNPYPRPPVEMTYQFCEGQRARPLTV
jgi:hypothetical protein